MPNWCNNSVEISHPDKSKMFKLVEAVNAGKFCNFAIPVPESLHIVAGSLGDSEEQKKLEEATAKNVEVHGYGNWYDFCVNEWGTKWDVDPYDPVEFDDQWDKNKVSFGFDSAWAPPVGVYAALTEQGFQVKAYYWESGMGFAGMWEDGNDDYYELGDMTSQEVVDTIPAELDEMMGISETIASYEEENADE